MSLWIIFITGLTVGGLTCLAVQGGLLASVIAAKEDETTNTRRKALYATSVFLLAKFIAHVLLGSILGAFGGAINIGGNVQTVMQLIAGLYMVAVALNLLNVHPIFRYVVIQPPRFLTRLVKNQSRSKDLFAPALLGAMTIFIPCGTTLAMEALSISSSNPVSGAAIMGAFILGTIPVFLGIGALTSYLGDTFKSKFLKIAAVMVLYLGITSINGSLIALDFPVNSQKITQAFPSVFQTKQQEKLYSEAPPTQNAEIIVSSSGYSPNYLRVKKDLPVTVKIIGKDAYSCASAFRIPSLGISKNLQPNETYNFTFTPKKVGKINFSCSMGMYSGVIEVI